MKKLFTIGAASVAALGALGGSVFAAPITTQGETPINASYDVDSAFTVTIPASINFSSANTSVDEVVSANNLLLDAGKVLTISMKSTNGKLLNTANSFITYSYTLDSATTTIAANTNYELLSVESGNKTGASKDITFTAGSLDNVTLAGLHSDTLTFKVDVSVPPVLYMQDIASLKSSFDTKREQKLTDSRDNKTYYVAKFNDGNIWMVQNLDYVPNGSSQATNGIIAGNGNIYTDGTASTSGGTDAHFSLGAYYNYNAAIASCPSGWQVPSKAQFNALKTSDGLSNTNNNIAPFYFLYGGNYDSTISFEHTTEFGQVGSYWASDASPKTMARFASGMVYVGTTMYPDTELSVRCIAK